MEAVFHFPVPPAPSSSRLNGVAGGAAKSFDKAGAGGYVRRRRVVSIKYSIQSAKSIQPIDEIRVCTNRSCRKQGSMQTLETLAALAPPNIAVKSCGCLGRCGAGPNLVALPAATLVSHCGTTARVAEVLVALVLGCGSGGGGGGWNSDAASGGGKSNAANISIITNKSLEALALRNKARNELVDKKNFSQADLFLTQAIELRPIGGVHILYKDRSLARLASRDYSGALDDAAQALALNPRYSEAYICQGDAFLALNQLDSSHKSYLTALQIDPSIRRSKSFKARIVNLEKLTAVNTP